ncbi:MAG: hypothetical protein EBQ52_00365, partial [Synechococcaceae bacterium LLD_019]|nr:hypothetical protein [Synechococcaceae bacterium LLD_019]
MIYGNSGNDTFVISSLLGAVSLFGGNNTNVGDVDTDSIQIGAISSGYIYADQGNDWIAVTGG